MGHRSAVRCRSDRSPSRKVPEVTQRSNPMHVRLRMVTALLASLFAGLFAASGVVATQAASAAPGHSVQVPPPSGDNGTTINLLQNNCGNDAPTCGQVGESYGYYNGEYNVHNPATARTTTAIRMCPHTQQRAVKSGQLTVGIPERQFGERDITRQYHSPGHALHPGTAFLQCAAHAVHGHSDLHRPPSDDPPLAHRRCPARRPVARQPVQRADPGA